MANNQFKIEGILHVKQDTEHKTSTFCVREFVLKFQDGNYEQYGKFQLTQSYCDLLDNFSPGEPMTVHFNIRGREHQGKFFTTLQVWKIEQAGQEPAMTALPNATKNGKATDVKGDFVPVEAGDSGLSDDLPF